MSETVKQAAKQRSVPWAWVRDRFVELWEIERAKREHDNEVRQYAWEQFTTPGSWPFWRHGFASRYGRLADRLDYSYIPGHDTLAKLVASRFPEYDTPDGTERLWHFLLSTYDKLPDRETLYWQALDQVEQLAAADAQVELAVDPF